LLVCCFAFISLLSFALSSACLFLSLCVCIVRQQTNTNPDGQNILGKNYNNTFELEKLGTWPKNRLKEEVKISVSEKREKCPIRRKTGQGFNRYIFFS